jgi:hypothetical protein
LQSCEKSEIPHFLDSRFTDGTEVVNFTRYRNEKVAVPVYKTEINGRRDPLGKPALKFAGRDGVCLFVCDA